MTMMNLIIFSGLIFPIIKNDMKLEINSKKFDVHLEENITAKSFVDKLPIKVNMKDLNGNELIYQGEKVDPVKIKYIIKTKIPDNKIPMCQIGELLIKS